MEFCNALLSHSFSAGKPLSSYTPVEARSLMETMPILMGSCGLLAEEVLAIILLMIFEG
jgi:hypothetical protein